MATIGTFKPTATGFEGTIATLMTNKKVRFVANEKKKTEQNAQPHSIISKVSRSSGRSLSYDLEALDPKRPPGLFQHRGQSGH